MQYDRTVVAYHGCEAEVGEELLRGESFRASENDYDWLGTGIYFWEYGIDRAWRWAKEHRKKPAVVGALVQLGKCFDLMDTRFTADLKQLAELYIEGLKAAGKPVPANLGAPPTFAARYLDCAVLNWYLGEAEQAGMSYDTVRCGFVEGAPVYPGMGIHEESHIQLSVRNPACIIGVFAPYQVA